MVDGKRKRELDGQIFSLLIFYIIFFVIGLFWGSYDQERAAEALWEICLYGAYSSGQCVCSGRLNCQRYVHLPPRGCSVFYTFLSIYQI